MNEPEDFIDPIIPPEKIGTGPDDGLDHDFRAGCGAVYVPPNDLVGSLRTSTTTFS